MEPFEIKDGKTDEGQDRVIKVRITKMSAYKAEQWIYRAVLALGKNFTGSFSGMRKDHGALISALASVDYAVAKPLLDDLLSCCEVINGNQIVKLSEATSSIIQSPVTLMRLRIKAAKENFGFFQDGESWSSLFG